MQAKLGADCVLIPTESHREPYVKVSIDQTLDSNQVKRLKIVDGAIRNDGTRSFCALFAGNEADLKITVTNESNRNVALIYETTLRGQSPYMYRPGQTCSHRKCNLFNNNKGLQGNLHFDSRQSSSVSSQLDPQIKVYFYREISRERSSPHTSNIDIGRCNGASQPVSVTGNVFRDWNNLKRNYSSLASRELSDEFWEDIGPRRGAKIWDSPISAHNSMDDFNYDFDFNVEPFVIEFSCPDVPDSNIIMLE